LDPVKAGRGDPRLDLMKARQFIRDDRMTDLAELTRRFMERRLFEPEAQEHLLEMLREKNVHSALILEALQRRHHTYPEQFPLRLEYARHLHEQNQPELALEILRDLQIQRNATVLVPSIARLYADLGHRRKAQEMLQHVSPVVYGQFPGHVEVWLDLFCESPRQEQTRRILATYYRRGGQVDMNPLLQWLECRGHLDDPEQAVDWLRLSDRQILLLRKELLQRALQEKDAVRVEELVSLGAVETLTESQDLRAAAELVPGNFIVARHLADILAHRRHWQDAATIIQRYLTAAGDNAPHQEEAQNLLQTYRNPPPQNGEMQTGQ
jgi:hypothetical protein